MLPRRFNYVGASLDTITRLAMLYAIADTLGKPPDTLPPMSDAQLWRSFKTLPRESSHYDPIPPEIRNQLNPGDFFALEFGRWVNSSVFPEGGNFEEIENNAMATAGPGKDAKDREFGSWFLVLLIAFILKGLEHPQAARHAAFLGFDFQPLIKRSDEEANIELGLQLKEFARQGQATAYKRQISLEKIKSSPSPKTPRPHIGQLNFNSA